MDELMQFANLLLQSRRNRTRKQISELSGFSVCRIRDWEGAGSHIVLPKKEYLPNLCESYGIDTNVAMQVWEATAKAQRARKVVRVSLGKNYKKSPFGERFSGEINSSSIITRVNSQLSYKRYGRS